MEIIFSYLSQNHFSKIIFWQFVLFVYELDGAISLKTWCLETFSLVRCVEQFSPVMIKMFSNQFFLASPTNLPRQIMNILVSRFHQLWSPDWSRFHQIWSPDWSRFGIKKWKFCNFGSGPSWRWRLSAGFWRTWGPVRMVFIEDHWVTDPSALDGYRKSKITDFSIFQQKIEQTNFNKQIWPKNLEHKKQQTYLSKKN